MENKNDENKFFYTYSAKDKNEVEKIREKYIEKTDEKEDKMERLRRLDKSVTQKAQMISLTLGIIGLLILGIGMSLIMTELSQMLGIPEQLNNILGIVIGLIGCVFTGIAYPIYNIVVKRERAKIAPEILRLTDELMK